MQFLLLSFLVAVVATILVVRGTQDRSLSSDHDLSGPQKVHARPVSRIGGVAVLLACVSAAAWASVAGFADHLRLWLLFACSMPAFAAGIAEDLFKTVSPRRRLLATAASAALAVWLLDAVIVRADIPGIDWAVRSAPFAVLLTIFVVTGVTNSVNIIDGFNGLASMCVLMMLLAIAYVALQVGDRFVMTCALIVAGSTLGFFVWNFPAGLIFLGDGGAYLLGFLLAELSILLFIRNPAVSPLFTLLLCAYPIFETLFSIYRKKFLRGMSPGIPDGVHLHMLVYKRLIRWAVGNREARIMTRRNSMTSPYLWLLCMLSVIPAVLWWNRPVILAAFIFLFMLSYVVLYWSIVRFRSPKWLVMNQRRGRARRETP